MYTRLAILCFCSFLSFSPAASAQEGPSAQRNNEIVMYVGEVKILPVDKIHRIAVGNGKLFTTSVLSNKELLLIGEAPGDSSLIIWSDSNRKNVYTVRVSPRDSGDARRNVSALLQDIPGIQVTPVGPNVIISGIASKENLTRIATAVKMYPQATSVVREEEVSMRKMVYMKVQIIEMKKSVLENIGLQWPGSAAGPMLGFSGNFGSDRAQTQGALKGILPVPGKGGLTTYLGISTLINTTINLAKNNGDAYTLAEPELSARSGGEAKFLAGGQIPLPATSALGAGSVEFKDYGIRLSIKPVADDLGNIMASIKTEISSVDASVSVQGIPGFLTRQSESEINVKNGQTIVMSGLVNTEMSNDASKVPGLSSIPVLGRLFRSDSFKSGRTDLVVLVTPTIVDPASTINRERIEKGMDIRESFERKLSNQDIID
ncbi:type II and III secretion system protein family protein [Herminiimonas sp.]|uniref:type II and III secretion system protein family protein n=1 Tax=Herminiimonas sp. TaxID=1926289 RepID=UPI002719C095|nr:pilus assembly protein N-terminal domain-containing protein [Herminiimonas sp.]MDO8305302.1 pilus assembly protein N-terminal domain-containing protein [Herminiimonas sp.]